ncbi:MAG: iron ABC transporter permease [Actinomycetota bacterium]
MSSERSTTRVTIVFVLGGALLFVVAIVSLMLGAFTIAPSDVLSWITGAGTDGADTATTRVLSSIRLPRVVGSVLVGAALGSAGAVLQGLYRTPLADPHLLGYSSAAGLGAALGFAATPPAAIPLVPFALAAVATIAFGLASSTLRTRLGSDRLILAGVAFGLALLAWTGLFVLIIDSARVPTLSFFIFGSLAGATWKAVALTGMLVVPALCVVWAYGPGLDLLALGESEARGLGFDTRRLIPVLVSGAAFATAAAVGLGGVIGFVGLIVPFALRPVVGATHRVLIPAAALGGAVVLVVADTLARTVAGPSEIPLGLVTAAIGGPFLAWLLVRRRAL